MEKDDLPNKNEFFEYRKLVDDISTKLQRENALRLANLYSLPSWYFEVGPSLDPTYALRVFIAMEGKGVFSPENLKGLLEALKNVQREDLCTLVKEFIKLKYEHGATRERTRRQTYPQESVAHPHPKVRSSSNIVYHNTSSLLNSPHLHYSTSLCSIAVDTHDMQDDEETDGLKSKSHPDLSVHSREKLDGVGGSVAKLPIRSLSPAAQSMSVAGFKLVLFNAESLVKQIDLLMSATTGCVLHGEDTPAKENEYELLASSYISAEHVVQNLQHLSKQIGSNAETMDQRASHASSYATCISPTSSFDSFDLDEDTKPNFLRNEAAILKDSSKHREVSQKEVSSALQSDSVQHPSQVMQQFLPIQQSHPILPSSLTSRQPNSISASNMTRLSNFTSRSRHRRWKEGKKMNKHGILIWNLKVEKLKHLLLRQEIELKSEKFYDNAKRPVQATLLREDCGSHMTLMINCLEEPKASSIPNLEIVVNVIDPHSDSEVPLVWPIRRSLERRGIRIVQQFLTHSTINTFQSSYITVSIAIIDRLQVESETEVDL